jgi:octaprenyl-diphosphate synthase
MDDMLDFFADTRDLGKPTGLDVGEGVLTLPLIYTLRQCGPKDRRTVERMFQSTNGNRPLGEARKLVLQYGGREYSLARAREYAEKARKELGVLKQSGAKQSLETLAQFVIERKY